MMYRETLLLSLVFIVLARKPNVFILLTDDQDALLGSTAVQPNLKKLIGGNGIEFVNGFVNHPVCCVSRSSLLTGRYSHNTKVVNNTAATTKKYPGNCTSPEWSANIESKALAVHMKAAGYHSIYMGKYMNDMHTKGSVPPQYDNDPFKYIPPGWNEWYGLQGNSKYYNYSVSNQGVREDHGYDYEKDYFTLKLQERAMKFLQEHGDRKRVSESAGDAVQPFFMMMGTPAAHANFIPPPQHWNLTDRGITADAKSPRTPNWNIQCDHCHRPVKNYPPMSKKECDESDSIYRRRLGTLAFVDDVLGLLWNQLEKDGEAEDTLFIYTADNGFHLGQWGQGFDKRQLYESDIRVPYFIRGPGVQQNVVIPEPVSHVDVAATILDFVGEEIPDYFDGRSFKPLLMPATYEDAAKDWDPRVFVQYFGESYSGGKHVDGHEVDFMGFCGNGISPQKSAPSAPFPGHELAPHAFDGAPCDGWNNTYTCTRKVQTPSSPGDYMFCEFDCFEEESKRHITCDASSAEGTGEYYNMATDPWQMDNTVLELKPDDLSSLKEHVANMRHCHGRSGIAPQGCLPS